MLLWLGIYLYLTSFQFPFWLYPLSPAPNLYWCHPLIDMARILSYLLHFFTNPLHWSVFCSRYRILLGVMQLASAYQLCLYSIFDLGDQEDWLLHSSYRKVCQGLTRYLDFCSLLTEGGCTYCISWYISLIFSLEKSGSFMLFIAFQKYN